MPVWVELYRRGLKTGRRMRRAGWPVLRVILAVLAALCMVGCGGGTPDPSSPSLLLSATSLSFDRQSQHTPSPAQSLSVTNTGNATLSISQIWLTGAHPNCFKETNTCGTSLAAGASCTISVQFVPNGSGSFTAAVTFDDNASNSPQSVALSGTGTASPAVSLSPTSLAFGNQAGGTVGSAQTLTVTNSSTATLSISQIWLTGAYPNCFRESNSCGTSLAAGAICTISVQFAPKGNGSFAAAVTFDDNAANSPQSVPISGTGTSSSDNSNSSPSANSGVSISPSSLSFANQPVDVASSSQTVTFSNNASTALSVPSIALTGADPADFTENNTCGLSVAAGGSCTIVTLFIPTASGSRSASLSITDNASGSPQTVALSGTGTHDVTLTWSASAGAAGYDVYRGASPGGESSTPLNSQPITGSTYTDTSVQSGQTYYYKLTSVASDGTTQSGSSTEVSASVPSS